MTTFDLVLIIEALIWMLVCVIPFLVGMVFISCWLRNRAHHQQHEQIEQIMMEQFHAFTQTGRWPDIQSRLERKAMKMLAQRLDLQGSRPQRL